MTICVGKLVYPRIKTINKVFYQFAIAFAILIADSLTASFCDSIQPNIFGIGSWEIKDEHFTKPLTDQYNTDTPAAGGAIVNRPEYLFWRGSKHTMDEIDNELRKQKLI